MKICLGCDKEVSDKAKYCSDKCRMAYGRSLKKGEQIKEPEQPKAPRTLDFSPTRTDRLFETHQPHYYKFDKLCEERICQLSSCDNKFRSHLELLKYCSPKHMVEAIGV